MELSNTQVTLARPAPQGGGGKVLWLAVLQRCGLLLDLLWMEQRQAAHRKDAVVMSLRVFA